MSIADVHLYWPASRGDRVAAVREDECAADPSGPPSRWVYGKASIGFVTRGSFEYASAGRAFLAAPGAVILGNPQEEFSVRHVDTLGNRRLVATLTDDFIEGVADDAGLAPRFETIAIPPGREASRLFALMRSLARGDEDALASITHAALTAGRLTRSEPISARDRRRVLDAMRHIESNFDQPCPLQTLADIAGLSRFRFARLFSAIVGLSPNQYLINTRVRVAADRLTTTKAPIAQIAFDVGFNDLSHFYGCFREAFACTPRQWRLRG